MKQPPRHSSLPGGTTDDVRNETEARLKMPPLPTEDKKRLAQRALLHRILTGDGRTSNDQRLRAFNNADLPEPLSALLDLVATRPTQVTEADFAATGAS